MVTRIFLSVVGVAYLFLAGWCALKPEQTSASVGFSLERGSGQSEFLTVYGGLQLALGAVFLLPWIRGETTAAVLLLCLWIHGCLVVFRSLGFLAFREIPTMTYGFSALEWLIFLGSAGVWWSGAK